MQLAHFVADEFITKPKSGCFGTAATPHSGKQKKDDRNQDRNSQPASLARSLHPAAKPQKPSNSTLDLGLVTAWNLDGRGSIELYSNDGDGRFSYSQTVGIDGEGGGAEYLSFVDLDVDGDLDMLSSFAWSNPHGTVRSQIVWHENLDGRGQFDSKVIDLQDPGDESAATSVVFAVDLDSDGDLDVLTDQKWLENDGTNHFDEQHILGDIVFNRDLAPGDIDLDGDIDLAVVTPFGLNWLVNNNGTFEESIEIVDSGTIKTTGVELVDLDNDGDLDIVAEVDDDQLMWFINDDSRGFFEKGRFFVSKKSLYFAIDDLDGDGDMDVVTTSPVTGSITWHENQLIGTPGDSNRDGVFNSSDLVAVFQAGEYEDDIDGNSTFEEGDWNNDGDFNSSDLVFAFKAGNYVLESRHDRELAADLIFAIDEDDERKQRGQEYTDEFQYLE